MKWKGFATAATLAALLVSGCGGSQSSSSAPIEASKVKAPGPRLQHPQANVHTASTARSERPAESATSASSKPHVHSEPHRHKRKRPKAAATPEATSPPKPHPAIERLLESSGSGGQGPPAGTGGTEVTPHRAEKLLHRLKEEAREGAKDHGAKEGAVEKILGELTGG